MTRTDVINHIISNKLGYKASYLEIGLNRPEDNYFNVFCAHKECVDPMYDDDFTDMPENTKEGRQHIIDTVLTYRMISDDFFATYDKKYDIIFIDGLHLAEQVQKDIINAYNHLNDGGYIVLHDCIPASEASQKVPREVTNWNGSVWKAIPNLYKAGLEYYVVDTDNGCGVIKHTGHKDFSKYTVVDLNYNDVFLNNSVRNPILRVVSEEEFLSM